jgi:transposase
MSPMKGDKITLSQKQLQKFRVMSLVEAGKITLKEAADKIGRSYRQAKRIWKRVKEEGVKGVIHGNAGKLSNHRTPEEVQEKVLQLSRQRYGEFNDTHFTEKLLEQEGLDLSRETVRKMRREAGIEPKRKRRPKKHRQRRERKAQEGWMVLWDGSPHPWFGPDHPPCCLMAALDDATGAILAARFFPFEGTEGYLWLLQQMVTRYGMPISIYQDCHGSLRRNDDHWTLEEELAGRQEPTQVGQALRALGIQPIFALSPQAKGRIERLFGVLQDRLGAELGLAKATTPEQGNDLLPTFVPRFNRRFAIPPRQSEKAWRPVPKTFDIDRAISFHYPVKVGLDNTVRLGSLLLDIAPGPLGRSYAKARVEVRQLLNGSWRVYHRDRLIAKHPSTVLREPIRALRRNRSHASEVHSYNWIYQASAQPIDDKPLPK